MADKKDAKPTGGGGGSFASTSHAIVWGIVGLIILFTGVRTAIVKNNANIASKKVMPSQNLVTIDTNMGRIVFETFDQDAPKASQNFMKLAKQGFYNNVTFHRVIKGFMIQGGDPTGTGRGGPGYSFEDELNPSTDSYKTGYKKGVVAMANAGPNTNGSQFFIMLADYPLPHNYTIFGRVVSGQEVVDKIGQVATDSNDKPVDPVIMTNVFSEAK